MRNKNELIEIQKLLKKQMHRLDEAISKEVAIETARSGAMSQNANAFCKAVGLNLRVKELCGKNPQAEETILNELGVLRNED